MSGLDRTRPPAAAAPAPWRLPAFERQRLASGLEVIACRMPRVPLVSIQLLLPAGGEHDPVDRPGLATLTAALLDEGTPRRSSSAIAALVEGLGGYLSTSADWDATRLGIGLLARELPTALDLLAELALQPTLPAEEVERLRRQRAAELLRRRDQPATLAEERLARAVFADTPYGRPLIGDEKALAALTRQEIVDFHRGHLAPGRSALVAAGDLDPGELLARASAAFSAWPSAETPAQPTLGAPFLSATTVHIIDRPGATQTELRIGHAGIARRHPDYPAASVLNALLGGKFTSRLNLNLRERHGYTYGASSRFTARRGAGPFVVAAAVGTEVTGAAAREALAELRRVREEPVSAVELADTLDYLLGVFPYTLQTADDVVGRIEDLALYDLPDDHYARQLEAVRATSAGDLLRTAQALLHPERAAIVAVGPAQDLRSQLEELGEVVVWPATVRASEAFS